MLAECSQEQKRYEPNCPTRPPHREKFAPRIETLKNIHHQKFQAYMPLVANKEQILNVITNKSYVK